MFILILIINKYINININNFWLIFEVSFLITRTQKIFFTDGTMAGPVSRRCRFPPNNMFLLLEKMKKDTYIRDMVF